MKLAGTAALDARAVLVIDSDAVLLREATLEQFTDNGSLWHFRRDHGVTAAMRRHLVWHNVARRLLGLSGTVAAPAPDYISPISVWDPTVVRSLLAHIADCTGRDWMDAVAGELHVSEFVVYGVFVDHVLGGMTPFPGPLCHNYYERVPLGGDHARAFADRMPSSALGAMISSHSHTPPEVRREVFRRCGEIAEGAAPNGDWARPVTWRRSWHRRCLDGAIVLAQLSAVAPAGLGA